MIYKYILLFVFCMGVVCLQKTAIAGDLEVADSQLLGAFDKYSSYNDAVKLHCSGNVSKKECDDARRMFENYAENQFVPYLSLSLGNACREQSLFLINAFINLLIRTSNVSDESLADTLAKMYVCQPLIVVDLITNISNKEDRYYMASILELGFGNIRRYGLNTLNQDNFDYDLKIIKGIK